MLRYIVLLYHSTLPARAQYSRARGILVCCGSEKPPPATWAAMLRYYIILYTFIVSHSILCYIIVY